jgi:hypothetical protein
MMFSHSLPILFLLAVVPDNETLNPLTQLASPMQEVRDAAAKTLRATHTPTPRERWEPLLKSLNVADTKPAVLKRLPAGVKPEMGVGSGQSHLEEFRLDDVWTLRCTFRNESRDDPATLLNFSLIERTRHLWVAPPGDFSGTWTTYFVNGQKSHQIQYKAGKYSGEFIAFHSDGSKSYVQHYGPQGSDGEDTGYFPSGRVSYRAFYRAGAPVGTWTWYNEDGTVRSTKEHPK